MKRNLVPLALLVIGCGADEANELPVDPSPDRATERVDCSPESFDVTRVSGLAVLDDTLLVATWGAQPGSGTIARVDAECATADVIVDGQTEPRAPAVDDGKIYWVAEDGLWRAEGDGADAQLLLPKMNGRHVSFDDDSVYFSHTGGVERVDKADPNSTQTLAQVDCGITTSAVDETHVYITMGGCAGDVLRVPKSGGDAELIARAQWSDSIAIDEDHVYWSRHHWGALTKLSKNGGEAVVFPGVTHVPGTFAIAGEHLLYAGEYDVGGWLRAGSEQWLRSAPADFIAPATDYIYAAGRDSAGEVVLSTVPYPITLEPWQPATGDATLHIEWETVCEPEGRISLFLAGPTRRNRTVRCDDFALTFERLAPGSYTFVAEHPDAQIGFAADPFDVGSGETTIGPIDLHPF